MRCADVHVGSVYAAKVSGRIVPLQILTERRSEHTGRPLWRARNLRTGRELWVRSPQRLRHRLEATAEQLARIGTLRRQIDTIRGRIDTTTTRELYGRMPAQYKGETRRWTT